MRSQHGRGVSENVLETLQFWGGMTKGLGLILVGNVAMMTLKRWHDVEVQRATKRDFVLDFYLMAISLNLRLLPR